jgi:hypothetical protein
MTFRAAFAAAAFFFGLAVSTPSASAAADAYCTVSSTSVTVAGTTVTTPSVTVPCP